MWPPANKTKRFSQVASRRGETTACSGKQGPPCNVRLSCSDPGAKNRATGPRGTRPAKETSACFSPTSTFSIFFQNRMAVVVWVCFWILYSVLLVCVSISVPLPCGFGDGGFEIGYVKPPALLSGLRTAPAILGPSRSLMNFSVTYQRMSVVF